MSTENTEIDQKSCGAFWEHCNQSCFAPCDHPYCPGPHPNIKPREIR